MDIIFEKVTEEQRLIYKEVVHKTDENMNHSLDA